MRKYSLAREKAIRAFDRDYFTTLYRETSGDIVRASRKADVEIEHLLARCRDLGIKWPKRAEIRRLTTSELAEIERRLDADESPSAIAIRFGVGKSRIKYQKTLIARRKKARKR